MARLTNRQLEIVVDEIFNQISLPIIANNKALLAEVELPEFTYLKDYEEFKSIGDEIEVLKQKRSDLSSKYKNIDIDGFKIDNWTGPFLTNTVANFITFQKESLSVIKVFPSKDDIERQVILAGNSDIQEIIKKITEYYNK